MAEKLLPLARTHAIGRSLGCGLFILGGLAAVTWGLATAHPSGGIVALFGALSAVVFLPPGLSSLPCGLYFAPTVIPINDFICDDGPLPAVLTNWWRRHHGVQKSAN